MVGAVDVGGVGLQQLVKSISHLFADPGQHMRFHHEKEAQREENLDAKHTRDIRSAIKYHLRPHDEQIKALHTEHVPLSLLSTRVSCLILYVHQQEVRPPDRDTI